MRVRIISRFRFTFIFRNAGGRLLALFAESKIISCILEFILIVILFEIGRCESFHRHLVSRFSIRYAKYHERNVTKKREKEFPWRSASRVFDVWRNRRVFSRKEPRKGETCFWDRVTHIRIRDCPLIPIACAMQSVAPRCNAVAARPLSRRPQARKWRYPPCLHTRVGRPVEANVS